MPKHKHFAVQVQDRDGDLIVVSIQGTGRVYVEAVRAYGEVVPVSLDIDQARRLARGLLNAASRAIGEGLGG